MSGNPTDDRTSDSFRTTRRSVLRAAAATGIGLAGTGITVSAQESTQQTVPTFAFGTSIDGWHGVAPDPIAGTVNPKLQLEAGQTYRLVWQNRDGRPHGFSITDESGVRLDALRVLSADADELEVFDGPPPDGSSLSWSDVSDGSVQYLDADSNPIAADGIDSSMYVNATQAEGADDVVVEKLAYSPVVAEKDGVQVVEFEATNEMASYSDVLAPFSAEGDLTVGSGQG